MSEHYLRKLDADMGEAEWEMFRAIPAEEIGWENPAHHMNYDEWRKWFDKYINGEWTEKRHAEHRNQTFTQISYIMYLEDYPIGLFKLKPRKIDRVSDDWAEIAYVIRPVCRGKNLGTKIIELGIAEAKKIGMSELEANVNRHNVPSWRAVEKCGFRLVGETEWGSRKYELKLKGDER
jgi:RimJ/RimL family protein N-acetyltransferase